MFVESYGLSIDLNKRERSACSKPYKFVSGRSRLFCPIYSLHSSTTLHLREKDGGRKLCYRTDFDAYQAEPCDTPSHMTGPVSRRG